jgi:hypothetical protein
MLSSVRPPASRASSFAAPTRKPLSDAAVAILEDLRNVRQADFVFTGGKAGRPISNMATLMLLRRMGRGDLTAHGFRSTFSDWCSERTNFPAEVREMALAHSVSDKVEAAYRRGDLFQKRRQLAEAWASALPLSAPSATRTGRCGAASAYRRGRSSGRHQRARWCRAVLEFPHRQHSGGDCFDHPSAPGRIEVPPAN